MTQSGPPADASPIDPALQEAWTKVWEISEPASRGWLSSTRPIALHDSLLVLAVPNEYTRDRVETRLRSSIEAQLTSHFGRSIQLATTIDPTTAKAPASTALVCSEKIDASRCDAIVRTS